MGKALYRSHRPKSLDEVIGQEHITDTLKNALKKGAVSHAYLFTGPKGTGKTSIARILAHTINEIDYQDESIHLDIIEIDAASNRRIDEIRELRDKVHIAPTSSKYKVYIIDEVHMLTREAFNALLKTLEEPPEHAVFILATTEAHKVPDTIISRTQRFTFKPIEQDKASAHLRQIADKEKIKISDDALKLLANHGRGSFRDSISMLDQLVGLAKKQIEVTDVQMLLGIPDDEIIDNALEALESNDIKQIFSVVQSFKEQGVDSGKAALSISNRLREALLNDSLNLNYETTINLLKELLELSMSSDDFLGLELALLNSVNTSELTRLKAQDKTIVDVDASMHKKPSPEIKEAKAVAPVSVVLENDSKEETSKKTSKQPEGTDISRKKKKAKLDFSKDVWNELLNELKKKHNTLYGVLRMANPRQEDDDLQLEFKFGFHKKQVDMPQNTALLREYLGTFFGSNAFTTKTASKEKNIIESTDSPQKQGDEDIVSSVSNIFGGAELIE